MSQICTCPAVDLNSAEIINSCRNTLELSGKGSRERAPHWAASVELLPSLGPAHHVIWAHSQSGRKS